MISFEEAHSIALKKIQSIEKEVGEPLGINDRHTEELEKDSGWIFFYNSKEFLESGDELDSLAGNGPLLVLTSGKLQGI